MSDSSLNTVNPLPTLRTALAQGFAVPLLWLGVGVALGYYLKSASAKSKT
jgi:hypothetical protein